VVVACKALLPAHANESQIGAYRELTGVTER